MVRFDTRFRAPFLWTGVTLADFQSCGKIPLLNDLVNMMDNGREMDSPINLIISIGQPSGPTL